MSNIKNVVEESFIQYAGAVLQSRALVDVRDCIKPSARQIFYCMQTDGFTHNKDFRKTLKAIGSAMRMYIHGDSSCEGVIMRAGQDFNMRYPLIEIEGGAGNPMESGNWSAPRYTSSRLSALTSKMFNDIDKNTINEWRDNYDDTEKYPTVLPSKGFYNICNGTMGIGIGMASSIPQFNVTEVNKAMIALLHNPNIDDDELICMPDFASGGILLNGSEVRESLKNGTGKSCKLRSVITWDAKDNCYIVSEIPYSVYTNTICNELFAIIESEENPGIESYKDLTKATPCIKIYLTKDADPQRVLNFLYKNTSLQYWYSINFTMLDQGRFPKVFTWKQALQAHIDHECEVYLKGYIYDRDKTLHKIHIIEGLLIALANIDEVVRTIKEAASTAVASNELQKRFLVDEEQAKAILDTKLARLARLEVQKLENEKAELLREVERLNRLIDNKELLNNEVIKGWEDTIVKYGDSRRTKVLDVCESGEERKEEPIVNIISTNGILTLRPFAKLNLADKNSQYRGIKAISCFAASSTTTSIGYDSNAILHVLTITSSILVRLMVRFQLIQLLMLSAIEVSI